MNSSNYLKEVAQKLENIKNAINGFKLDDVCVVKDINGAVVNNYLRVPIKYKASALDSDGVVLFRRIMNNGELENYEIYSPQLTKALYELADLDGHYVSSFPDKPLSFVNEIDRLLALNTTNYNKQLTVKNFLNETFSGDRVRYECYSAIALGEVTFELDDELNESLLLGYEYKPVDKQHEHAKLFNEINRHNKAHKIPLNDRSAAASFIEGLKVGDKFWTSAKGNGVTVTKVYSGYVVVEDEFGAQTRWTAQDVLRKRVYTTKPRSFKLESDS